MSSRLALLFLVSVLAPASMHAQPQQASTGKLTLTSKSAEAKAEFWKGQEDWQSFSWTDGMRHFRRAYALDKDFALARVFATGTETSPAATSARNAAIADAARQSTEEGILALMWREKALGNFAQMRILLQAAMKLMPNEPAPAVEYVWSGIDDAVSPKQLADSARALRAKFPNYAPLALAAAAMTLNAGDTAGALRIAEEWTRIAPRTPAAFAYYGGLLQQQRRYDEAEAQYRKGVQLLPARGDYGTDAASSLGEMYMLRGRTADARAVATEALSRSVDRADSALYLAELATTYYADGDNSRTMQLLQQARAKSEIVGSALNPFPLDIILAELSAFTGDVSSMRRYMDRIHRETPNDSALFYANYSEVYAYVGQLDSALAYSDKLATVSSVPWAGGIAHHTRAVAFALAKQCPRAHAEAAQASDSAGFELAYARAHCEFQMGNRSTALALRDRALASQEFSLFDPMYVHERRRLAQIK